jgi:uncharacterized phage protein (predicted DNA packaging)
MIIELDETKQYLKVEGTEDDDLINSLIGAAEMYLQNATNNVFDYSYDLAKLFCWVLVADWYENRALIGKTSDKIRPIINSMLTQLRYCYQLEADA